MTKPAAQRLAGQFIPHECLGRYAQDGQHGPYDLVDTRGAAKVLGVSISWLNQLRICRPAP